MARRFRLEFSEADGGFNFDLQDIATFDGETVSKQTARTRFTVEVNREDGNRELTFKAHANDLTGENVGRFMFDYTNISPIHATMYIANKIANMVIDIVRLYVGLHRNNPWEARYTEIGQELPGYDDLDVVDIRSMINTIMDDVVVVSFVEECVEYVVTDWEADGNDE